MNQPFLLFITEQNLRVGYATDCLTVFIYGETLGSFQFGAITDKAAVKKCVQVSVWT